MIVPDIIDLCTKAAVEPSHPSAYIWQVTTALLLVCLLPAQAIQRQLEEVAEKQRDVEERGVTIEKTIRGETDGGEESNQCL